MSESDIYITLLVASIVFRTLLDLWEIALERFTGGVYVNYSLGCKLCSLRPRTEDSYEWASSSPDGRLAWKGMREHYERSHPEQLWRVGRLPRGHSPSASE